LERAKTREIQEKAGKKRDIGKARSTNCESEICVCEQGMESEIRKEN